MKKISTFFAAIGMAMTLTAVNPTITTEWELKGGTKPSYMGTDQTRNMAFGTVSGNKVLALASRQDNKVHILDPATGIQTTTLTMPAVMDGVHTLGDIAVTSDGKILVCNLAIGNDAVASKRVFYVYQWNDLTSTPTTIISWTLPNDASRYGDHFTVTGSITDGTAKVYAASCGTFNQNPSVEAIKCWTMTGGSFINPVSNFNTGTLDDGGINATVCVLPNGQLLYKANNINTKELNPNGSFSTPTGEKVSSNSSFASLGHGVTYIGTIGTDTYLTYFRFGVNGTSITNADAPIVKVPTGTNGLDLSAATEVGATTNLHTTTNGNGSGRVAVEISGANIYLYVLGTNNGIGKYKVVIPDFSTGVTQTNTNNINITTIQGKVSVSGIQPSSIEIYNTLGQKLKSIANSSEIATDNLQGVYIVQVKAEGKVVKNIKIAIK